MIAVAPGAIASITRLRRARKLSPLPLTPIAIHYATQPPLTPEVTRSWQSRAWRFDLRGFDSSASGRTTLFGIGIRRCRDEQCPPVDAAEHACERVRLHLDPLDDLAALLHSNHFRRRWTRHPDRIFGVQTNSIGQAVSELRPHAPIRERSIRADIERRQSPPKRLTHDQRFPIRRDHHPVGKHQLL